MNDPIRSVINSKGHYLVTGITQGGKTYFSKEFMYQWPGPVVFINTQSQENKLEMQVDPYYETPRQILKALKEGGKIEVLPGNTDKETMQIIDALVDVVFLQEWTKKPLLFVTDEAQDFAREGKDSQLHKVARRGLGLGITGLFICQAPADVSKVIVKQCRKQVIFILDQYEKEGYFKRYNLPGEEIVQKLRQGGEYSFVIYDKLTGELTGPYKL